METLAGTPVPVRLWTDPSTVEEAALQQLRNVADLPWVHGVSVMPDVHVGAGATVGSVIAMEQALAPAAVGVDIGCGMTAVRSDLVAGDLPEDLGRVRSEIEQAVPLGMTSHPTPVDVTRLPGLSIGDWDGFWSSFDELHPGVQKSRGRAQAQVGTLGSGNHFIEVVLDETDRVWVVLHSGSRYVGKALAEKHIGVAQRLAHNADLPDRDLAVFLSGTPEMAAYRRDLFWAQDYARRNRAVMTSLVTAAVRQALGRDIRWGEQVSCHHNYVSEESYDGVELLVTRKGAIRAGRGELGIIPGSMGTRSYIVRGLGNQAAYCSASHGAGRRMSRGAARRQFTVADLEAQTRDVECRKDGGVLDEIPAAYKDIDQVMAQQRDLVDVVHTLRQVVCVKG